MTATHSISKPVQPCDFEEALRCILQHSHPLPAERLPLAGAYGRLLREDVVATEDFPPFDRSAMDGWAARADDCSEIFQVVDEIRAGEWKPRTLKHGEAVAVATGAALPCNGLVVVPQEDGVPEANAVRFRIQPGHAKYIRRRGEDWKAGTVLVCKRSRLNAGALAMLAQAGHCSALVSRLPRVLHLVTGDELAAPDAGREPGQVRDVNSVLISALMRNRTAKFVQRRLPEKLDAAQVRADLDDSIDMLLVSGGASVGRHDGTALLLEQLGFTLHIRGVLARPGRPLLFGSNGHRIAFGLPGNPLAHWVCFYMYVLPALRALEGAHTPLSFLNGRLAASVGAGAPGIGMFIPAAAIAAEDGWLVKALHWNSSGDITPLLHANALLHRPAGAKPLPAGAVVQFLFSEEATIQDGGTR